MQSFNSIINEETADCLAKINPASPPTPEEIETELLDRFGDRVGLFNAVMPDKTRRYRPPTVLPNIVIAKIVLRLYPIRLVCLGGGGKELALYHDKGKHEGLYVLDLEPIKHIIEQYNMNMSERDIKEVIEKMKREAVKDREVPPTNNPDLIAVNNGIFDYKLKILRPFSPDMVFLSKSSVNYNPAAKNITIHNDDGTDWNVEDWMRSLSDDPEIVELLWQLLGAVIRPNVAWNKSAWLYATSGNNGKGTLCELMRALCGEDACDSISIKQFSEDVFLEKLVSISAVIADENDVGIYVDSAAKLKAAITGDTITINRKYLSRLKFKFKGMIVQCINELPRIRDRSDSFRRRFVIIPMTKCFTGCERKYIKEDYLHRQEVLEYVLYKVLNMNYYSLSEPQVCKDLMSEYVSYNDPIQAFWDEFKDKFVWNFLPNPFLYDLYKAWFVKNYPGGKLLSNDHFHIDLRSKVSSDPDWTALDSSRYPGNKINMPEPLIVQYHLTEWMDKFYTGADTDKKATPSIDVINGSYRGLQRNVPRNTKYLGSFATESEQTADDNNNEKEKTV